MSEIIAGEVAQDPFDSIKFGDQTLSLRDLTIDEQSYQIASIWFKQQIGDLEQKHAAIVASYESQVNKLQDDVAELESLRKANVDLTDKLADMETKRDAAASELFAAQEEAKRLATDNESLRKQLETSNKPLQTNITTDASDLVQQFINSRPAVYDVEELPNGNRKAKLLETDEVVVWEKIYPGKYRIASAEEVQRFRQEAVTAVEIPASVEEEHISDNTLAVEPPPAIPSETTADELVEEYAGMEVAGEPVTREEFQALKADVEKIKRTLNIESTA